MRKLVGMTVKIQWRGDSFPSRYRRGACEHETVIVIIEKLVAFLQGWACNHGCKCLGCFQWMVYNRSTVNLLIILVGL